MARAATGWTTEQVLELAPDAAGARAARSLARASTWTDVGNNESLLWGKCHGSSKDPYSVTVDLTEPAFQCSCPSRKSPCKHGVALLLRWVDGERGYHAGSSPPAWGRPPARPASSPKVPADPESSAKRLGERLRLMTGGLDELERWLFDLVRTGTAAARRRPLSAWDAMAARLVDAQLPGLADRVRAAPALLAREDWTEALLAELGRWYLAVRAWRRREDLDEDTVGDLRTYLGWPRRTEEVLTGRRVSDRWLVVGRRLDDDGRLASQRTWLQGLDTGRTALLLDFAAAGASLRRPGLVGSILEAEVAVYPGAAPSRVLLTGDERVTEPATALPGAGPIGQAFGTVAAWLAGNPWSDRLPMTLASVTMLDAPATLVDAEGSGIPLSLRFEPWTLLALTGGRPADVFGEWERGALHPLSVLVDGRIEDL